jgi:uncharacterized protein (TIGR00369 family)
MNKIDLSKIKTAEQLNDLCKGTFVDYLGIEMISVDDVGAVARMKTSNINMAPNGYVHGGVIASLAETTCGNGTIFHLGKEEVFSTIEFKINFVSAPKKDKLLCKATIVHNGRTTQVWDAEVIEEETSRILAHYRCTQIIMRS